MWRWVYVFLIVLLNAVAPDDDASARAKKELLPRKVTVQADAMPLSEALAQLVKQTGNHVVDRRRAKTDPKLKLGLDNSTFWPALDVIARAAGCAISTYQPDGQIALVDGPARPEGVALVHQGIMRIIARHVAVAQDAEVGTHVCTVTLDIAWEPRFEPLYLELGAVQAVFAADANGVEREANAEGQGKISVAGRSALQVAIRLPAAKRSSEKIKSLTGRFKLIGPAKMLTFVFGPLKAFKKSDGPYRQTQEEVGVSLEEVRTTSSLWSVLVRIDNPPGNPQFESYQSWLGNNRVSLEKGDGLAHVVWVPRPGDELVERENPAGAVILYSFSIPSRERKGPIADWKLYYRTPAQIVAIDVPFAFKDLPLP